MITLLMMMIIMTTNNKRRRRFIDHDLVVFILGMQVCLSIGKSINAANI